MGFRDRFSKLIGKKKDPPPSPSTPVLSKPVAEPEVVTAVEPAPKPDSSSLWDTAYDQLKTRKGNLVEEYEAILVKQDDAADEASDALAPLDDRPVERRTQMRTMAENALRRINESRQGQVVGAITNTAKVLSSVKGVVDAAVKASPEASAVWAGICFAIPFVENLAESTSAMQEGFIYLTSRMEYYAALEQVLFRPTQSSMVLDALIKASKPDIIRLYGQIIEYITQCVIQVHSSRTKQVVRAMLDLDGWKASLKSVKETELIVARNAEQMGTSQGQETISRLRADSAQVAELFQSLMEVSREQLLVARQEQEIAEKNHDLISQQLELSKEAVCRNLTHQEQENLHIFVDGQQDYADWKNQVQKRLDGTCKWLLEHANYLEWMSQSSGPILISADPGCGKSVLARFLVDEQLPSQAPDATICYFFFKDQTQSRLQQALCAVIHQLLKQHPSLIKLNKDGRSVTRSKSSLWHLFSSIVSSPEAGQVVCVFDALDECKNADRRMLAGFVRKLFSPSVFFDSSKFKMVMTTRPYDSIVSCFGALQGDFPTIRIPGESELSTISEEINIVVKYRVEDLRQRQGLKASLAAHLEQRLLAIQHRTYLWVYLVFSYLEDRSFKMTEKGIDEALKTLPETVEDAYEGILQRAQDKAFAFRAFCLVLAAERPLMLREMNEAINTTSHTKSFRELDLESKDDFKRTIRRQCGLMLSVYENKVHFLHQTVREFLLSTTGPSACHPSDWLDPAPALWRSSIPMETAHGVMADCCLEYMNLLEYQELQRKTKEQIDMVYAAKSPNPGDRPTLVTYRSAIKKELRDNGMIYGFIMQHWFSNYCGQFWKKHLSESVCPDLQLDGRCADLFNHGATVRHLLDAGRYIMEVMGNELLRGVRIEYDSESVYAAREEQLDYRDFEAQHCTLIYMIRVGVVWLVEKIVREDRRFLDFDERWPQVSVLRACIHYNQLEFAGRLLELGADPHDHFRQKALLHPKGKSKHDFGVPEYLLAVVAEIHAEFEPPGLEQLMFKFLERGASLMSYPSDTHGREREDPKLSDIPIFRTMYYGGAERLARLITIGAVDVNATGPYGSLLHLCWGRSWGRGPEQRADFVRSYGNAGVYDKWKKVEQKDLCQFLVDQGADVNYKNYKGRSPLFHANHEVIQILVENGADVHTLDNNGVTPLHLAIGLEEVKILMSSGVHVDDLGGCGMTPAMYIGGDPEGLGHGGGKIATEIVCQLLSAGSDPTIVGPLNRTLLHFLLFQRPRCGESHLQMSIDKGADVNARDASGMTPLHYASWCDHMRCWSLLLQNGADPTIQDMHGRTALHLAIMKKGRWRLKYAKMALVRPFLEQTMMIKDAYGRLPMHYVTHLPTLNLFVRIGGCNPLEQDSNGQSLLDLTMERLGRLERFEAEHKSQLSRYRYQFEDLWLDGTSSLKELREAIVEAKGCDLDHHPRAYQVRSFKEELIAFSKSHEMEGEAEASHMVDLVEEPS